MGNNAKKRREKLSIRKRLEECDFIVSKASFVCGITLLLSIIFDLIIIKKGEINLILRIGCCTACIIVYFILMRVKALDNFTKSNNAKNFTGFTTIFAPVFFFLEKTYIEIAKS